jgi:transcriptional/translational regulatory protein YebC/TACO1
MLEVRQFEKSGKVELVSDDKQGENMIVSDQLLQANLDDIADRWNETEMEDGEVVIEIKPAEFGPVGDALSGADYCWDAAEKLDELASARKSDA